MFYKNILYVWPIWVFGFYSYFSGTAIYDAVMYQFYNVIFTGLPIVYFAVQDWEYPKQMLLDNPKKYKIGLLDIYFNPLVFWRWFIYGMWQGTLLLILGFYTLAESANSSGQGGSLEVDGMFVFGAVVIIVNLKVMISSAVWDFLAVFFMLGSIVSFFICFWGLSSIKAYYMYGVYQQILLIPETYVSFVFFGFSYILVDAGTHSAQQEYKKV
jgi:magnesium-transporting ATPase (P-type)